MLPQQQLVGVEWFLLTTRIWATILIFGNGAIQGQGNIITTDH